MNGMDYLLILLVAVCICFAVRGIFRRKKKGGCGCCKRGGCAHQGKRK